MNENYDLEKELEIITREDNIVTPANYGVTHFQRVVVELLEAAYHESKEKNNLLEELNKNIIELRKSINELHSDNMMNEHIRNKKGK